MDKDNNPDFPEQNCRELREQLQNLDEKMILPETLHPDKVQLKKKKISFHTFTTIAAGLVALLVSAYFLHDIQSQKKMEQANPSIHQLTANQSAETNYSTLKDLFLAFQERAAIGNKTGAELSIGIEDKSELNMASNLSSRDSISTTNNQVAGVQEADIVQTNGDYIFSARSTYDTETIESSIQITSSLRSGKVEEVGKITLSGNPSFSEMFLKDDLLVVITRPEMVYYEKETKQSISLNEFYQKSSSFNEKELKEFGQKYRPYESTDVFIYDVSQPNKPVLKRRFSQEGFYRSSRLIDNELYLISNKSEYGLFPSAEMKAENIEIEDIVPLTKDSIHNDTFTPIGEKFIRIAPNPSAYSFVIVSGLKITDNQKANTETFLGGSSEIYATTDTLYILSAEMDVANGSGDSRIAPLIANFHRPLKTNISKYTLKNAVPKMVATGEVPGGILNQFSVDEYDQHFRIATTTYPKKDSEKKNNNVYILDKDLKTVGSLTNLAPDENIHSARFMAEKGYLVTFEEVDPLFALDLSDPKNPKVLGELKIPGFSDYLHPYKENYLIGIGHDTKKNEYGGITRAAMKLSLFDISDPTQPKEVHKLVFGNESTDASVTRDHKALLFSESKNLFGFPISQYLPDSDEERAPEHSSRYYLFSIDVEKGFQIEEKFFSNSDTNPIQRSIYVDDALYLIANDGIKVHSLQDFSEIKVINFKK